jgi:hypothetical protein
VTGASHATYGPGACLPVTFLTRSCTLKRAIAWLAVPYLVAAAAALSPAAEPSPDAKRPTEAGLRTESLFDGTTLDGWNQIPEDTWIVKDGAMASTGAGRGVIYTAKDYSKFRLLFTMRHVRGERDHHACVLIFCARPQPDDKPLDALAGIQFQVPLGGHWDYRPGHNNDGRAYFRRVLKPDFDPHEWSRVEILADAATGTARMAVAQPVGSKAFEVLRFQDESAGRAGPVAWQMHNATLFDEFKDVQVEIDPEVDELVTIR